MYLISGLSPSSYLAHLLVLRRLWSVQNVPLLEGAYREQAWKLIHWLCEDDIH